MANARTAPSKYIHLQLRKVDRRETYIFRCDRETIRCMIDRLEAYACDERLSFTWDDFYLLRDILLGKESSPC